MSIVNLSASTVDRLMKLCGLLGADAHHGERATAALKATELLKQNGLTWSDLIQSATRPNPFTAYQNDRQFRPDPRPAAQWRQDVATLLEQPDGLTGWEQAFLTGISVRTRLTAKQQSWLGEILRNAGMAR